MLNATVSPSKIVRKQSMTNKPLSLLQPGDEAIIDHINGLTPGIRQRLLELGLTRGTRIAVIRYAPLGDPIEIAVRGYRLSLRKEEAASILVRKLLD